MSWLQHPHSRRKVMTVTAGLVAGATLPAMGAMRAAGCHDGPAGTVPQPGVVAGLRRRRHHPGRRRVLLLGLDHALLAGRADPALLRPGELGVRRPLGAAPRLRLDAYDLTGGRAYVKGIWASTFNYRPSNNTYYWMGCVEFNRTYVYTATAVDGPWTEAVADQQLLLRRRAARRRQRHHVRGVRQHTSASPSCPRTGSARSGPQQVFTTPSSVGTLEGSRFYKRNGNYYILSPGRPTASTS